MCRDGGRGNGHGGGRLSSLWDFVKKIISQEKKKKKKEENIHGGRRRRILSPRRSSFIVPNGVGGVLTFEWESSGGDLKVTRVTCYP
jgi:hypothetical protein